MNQATQGAPPTVEPSGTADAQALAKHCRPGDWQRLRPRLLRLGLGANTSPADVAQWLSQASAGSHLAARHALHALARQLWQVRAEADGSIAIEAGGHTWRLQPVPAIRPVHWRVSRPATRQTTPAA